MTALEKKRREHTIAVNKHNAAVATSVTDFQIKVERSPNECVTISIMYCGRPCGGMYGFGGSLRTAKEDMAGLLRKLAEDVERL